jgi:hypothetical protein
MVKRVLRVVKVLQVLPDVKALEASKAYQGQLVLKELQVLLVPKAKTELSPSSYRAKTLFRSLLNS